MVEPKHKQKYYSGANDNWERSRKEFIRWIQYECGYKKDSEVYKDLHFLVNGPTDIQNWIDFFDGDIENIAKATTAYKQWRKDSCKLTLDDFLYYAEMDLESTLDALFMEFTTKRDVVELRIMIHEGKITLEELYNLRMSNPLQYNSLSKFLDLNKKL
ncbi:hypothetical protein [Paenibacillus elgii]|uniref:hypothetical protein n=1 Tax=Paenibacillus elgii TaxID=189691 RepID=UPI000248C6C9|nr:hypothetical protein [Paenibacillus elgii]